jgi:hypothetical protein
VDSHHPARRSQPFRARQRQQSNSTSARRRSMQQTSGSVASPRRDEDDLTEQQIGDGDGEPSTTYGSALRDRLQSSANATMSAVTDQMRRVSPQFKELNRRMRDPLARPSTWIVEPSWYERIHNWFAGLMPFGWRERARRRGFWRRRVLPVVGAVAVLAVGLAVGVFALKAAGHAAGALNTGGAPAQATAGGSVMISPLNNVSSTPTPIGVQYDIGVWTSDTLPQGGSVTVYARVSNNTQPQPGVKVYLSANTPNGTINSGSLTTDSYGLVTWKLNYGNIGPQKPIYLTGTTSIGGQTITGAYTVVTYG